MPPEGAAYARGPAPTAESRSVFPTPPVVHEVIHHLTELADGPAFSDEVAGRAVEWHHAVADFSASLAFGIEPDDPLHALSDQAQGPGLGIVVVVASVAQDHDGRLAIQGV